MKYSTPSPLASRKRRTSMTSFLALLLVVLVSKNKAVSAFQSSPLISSGPTLCAVDHQRQYSSSNTRLNMAQVSEQEAKKAIDAVVKALRSDSAAKTELGNLKKVENVLGFGSPQKGKLAVRFNASFQKGGSGFLGFGSLGKKKEDTTNKKASENQRGTMVGQVKASVDQSTGKVLECSVFRDLGYGRSFNLKTR